MHEIVREVRQFGCSSPQLWSRNRIDNYLKHCPAYRGHVYNTGDKVARPLRDCISMKGAPYDGFICHKLDDILAAPHLLDFILPFTNLAAEHFGEEPVLYSINSFWKKPGADQDWHTDNDDRKQLVMFIYGSDILDFTDGPHQYVKGSHLWHTLAKSSFHQAGLTPEAERRQDYIGPVGTYFFTDTSGLHRGMAPTTNVPRLLTWVRWGVSPKPHAYTEDALYPVPASKLPITIEVDHTLKMRTSLLIDWER